tara:strand:+ start:1203 stop:1736 length:534 start_codon:yes stop_codon:yes gene_type:complete
MRETEIVTLPMLRFKKGLSFSILKPLGYEFQKLYAANYMQWCIRPDGEKYGDAIRVWKKGRSVELQSLFELSGYFAEYIRDLDWREDSNRGRWVNVVFNQDTYEFEKYDRKIHESTELVFNMMQEKKSDEEIEEACAKHTSKYIQKVYRKPFVDLVKKMWADGYVEIIHEEKSRYTS